MMQRFLLALLILCFAAPAAADFDSGLAAYRSGDYDRAADEFLADAIQGHPTAQFNLGVMYYRGEGVARNLVTAFAWMNLATQHRGDEDLVQAFDILAITMSASDREAGLALSAKLARQHGLKYSPIDDKKETRLAGG